VNLVVADERGTLFIMQDTTDTASLEQSVNALDDPESTEDGEDERGGTDESATSWARLTSPDTEESPGDGNATSQITFGGGESVGCSSGFEGEEGQEDEEFGPSVSSVGGGVATKCFESSEEDEDGSPTVVEREWQVDENFIGQCVAGVMLLDDVIDVADRGADYQGQEEGDNVMATSPDVNPDDVENSEEGESPSNTIDDYLLASIGELIDDIA